MSRPVRLAWLVVALTMVWPAVGRAHDAGAWGGLFRSLDGGATWFLANQGTVVGGALALDVSPTDPTSLLLGTDSGLLASRNGGRDWSAVESEALVGPVFAVAFDVDGRRALAATARDLVRSDDGLGWSRLPVPTGAAPVAAIVPGRAPGRVYLLGWRGVFDSQDWGRRWTALGGGLPDLPPLALLVAAGPPETIYVLVGGHVWARPDSAGSWSRRETGLPDGSVGALALDRYDGKSLWAAVGGQLYAADGGDPWRAVGRPLPEPSTEVRAIALGRERFPLALATDRGLYRSPDRGQSWELAAEGLPAHLGAGLLVPDPAQADTLYAGFALTPSEELRRAAARERSSLADLAAGELAGAAALLGLLGLGGAAALRRLARRSTTAPGAAR